MHALSRIPRYMRGTQERGHVLGAVDEIVMTLDDNAMNLQSMAASRFVGPFFEKVQKWEKSLSHISEVVDVSWHVEVECMVVMETIHPQVPLLQFVLSSNF